MCLYPRLIKNKKYEPTKKNGGIYPQYGEYDPRTRMIPIGCGNCMECRKQKAREWQVRLLEDVKTNTNGIFVTLTFSNQSIRKLCRDKEIKGLTGYEKDNAIATRAVRLFTERWRKKFKKAPRHWLITELGHNGTENIHLHGFIWTNEPKATIKETWGYGFTWLGKEQPDGNLQNYVTERTVNYCIKYIYKQDLEHKYFKAKILSSQGIGKNYINTHNASQNMYREKGETNEAYMTRTGHKIALPKYYRNKIYTDQEREKLWIKKLDKQVRYINGIEIDISINEERYYQVLKQEQQRNQQLGYGKLDTDWDRKEYEEQRRREMMNKRLHKEYHTNYNPEIQERPVPF